MMETLRETWNSTLAFLTPYYNQAAAFARTLDPLVWWVAGGVLLALFFLWLLLRRRKADQKDRPEVLLSLGTVGAGSGEAGSSSLHLLRLTVSNLNPYAVQVLELALKTPEMNMPIAAEVAVVVPPEGSVALEQPLPGLFGEEGRLNLYFYTAGSKRIYCLQASFALEPWNNRYKISPLDQNVVPARQLASAGVSRVEEQVWRGEYEAAETETVNPVRAAPEPRERSAEPRRNARSSARSSARSGARNSARNGAKPRAGDGATTHLKTSVKTRAESVDGLRDADVIFPDEF